MPPLLGLRILGWPVDNFVEIYGLHDPDSGELRYIGKARDSAQRLKTHIWDARRFKRPVCLWILELSKQGKTPSVRVLERVLDSDWKAAERRLISQHREFGELLNLAPGGDMPSQTREQRQKNARKVNAKLAANPVRLEQVYWKRNTAKLYAQLRKKPDSYTYFMRLMMKCWAAAQPRLYGDWAGL